MRRPRRDPPPLPATRASSRIWTLVWLSASFSVSLASCGGGGQREPASPALHAGLQHATVAEKLSEAERGLVWLRELSCANCHESRQVPKRHAPDLRSVGARLSPDYLERYLADPRHVEPALRCRT